VQFEELRFVCQEAAIGLLEQGRPVPPTIVLPGPDRTRLLRLANFPDEDEARHEYLLRLAADELVPGRIPCWGFVSEAELEQGGDVVLVVFGARKHAPHLTAALVDDDATHLEEFVPSEELDPTAMPYLHPLQHAVDQLPAVETPPDGLGGVIGTDADPLGGAGRGPLPIVD
jgi:hypothetical protein